MSYISEQIRILEKRVDALELLSEDDSISEFHQIKICELMTELGRLIISLSRTEESKNKVDKVNKV